QTHPLSLHDALPISCRECHQNPTSGGSSQVSELRVGHRGTDGKFVNPDIPIARGTEIIKGRTLVNDRAICPNASVRANSAVVHQDRKSTRLNSSHVS